jgi:SAM-dependent methyltransferase
MLLGPRFIKNKILSAIIPRIMRMMQRKTWNQRKLLLQHVKGRVLDVGSGGGAYFAHFLPLKVSHVVALEPVQGCHDSVRQEAERVGLASYQVTIRSETLEEYCHYVKDHGSSEQFDWIILGNVLCEVQNVNHALEYVDQLLKPGGHVYFLEHLGCEAGSMKRKVQNFVNPWWKRISGGCNCNRDSLFAIEGMAQWDVISWNCDNITGPIMGPIVMGLAQKAIV